MTAPSRNHSPHRPTKGPNKSLGQHWLKNREILDQIATLAAPDDDFVDTAKPRNFTPSKSVKSPKSPFRASTSPLCLEIGPGLGTLTASLLRRFQRVIAVEYDPNLAAKLPQSFPGTPLEVVNADILDFDFSTLDQPYVVAGNIPYYITSPIIEKLLTAQPTPIKIVLLIQKEVAERIVSDKETYLSLWVKNRASVALGPTVPKTEFTPPPKVDSQVIILAPHTPEVPEETFVLIKRGFAAPRKKLTHNLASIIPVARLRQVLIDLGLSPDARPSDLHLADWQKLANLL